MNGKYEHFINTPNHCSLSGAMVLKARLEAYWNARGLDGVKIDVFSIEGTGMYSLRSNIADLLTVRARNVYSAGNA